MTAVTETRPLLRASSLRDCPRKAVFEATGAPGRERTPAEDGTLWRGKSIGQDYCVFLATQMRGRIHVESGPDYWVPPELRADTPDQAAVIAEQRVRWEHGVGHADIYIPETRTIVEVLSSAHASETMRHSKLLQAVIYTENHPHAENCALVIVSPTDFTTERVVLMPGTPQYRDLVDEMRDRVGQVTHWSRTGELPARVCGKPSESYGHFCMFAQHCFEGWERPPVEEVAADPVLVDAVREFAEAKAGQVLAEQQVRVYEQRRKAAQAVIEAAELPVKQTVRVGPFEVTRTAVQRKPSFDWEKAEMAGRFSPEPFAEFFRAGAAYSMFKAERVDMSGDEFGDDAPWTDADLEGGTA